MSDTDNNLLSMDTSIPHLALLVWCKHTYVSIQNIILIISTKMRTCTCKLAWYHCTKAHIFFINFYKSKQQCIKKTKTKSNASGEKKISVPAMTVCVISCFSQKKRLPMELGERARSHGNLYMEQSHSVPLILTYTLPLRGDLHMHTHRLQKIYDQPSFPLQHLPSFSTTSFLVTMVAWGVTL